MNTLRHDRNTLAHVTHTQLLKAVLESIKTHQFFEARNTHLNISIDTIADDVSQKIADQKFVSPVLTNATGMRTATIHFNDKTEREFTQLIPQIQHAIQSQFEKEMEHQNYDPQTYLKKGLASLQDLKKQSAIPVIPPSQKTLGLSYAFWPQQALQSKKLHLVQTPKDASSALFRLSRATLHIAGIHTISQQVSQSLAELCRMDRCMKESRGQSDVAEELHDDLMELLSTSLQDPFSEFVGLERFLQDETVGQFKKQSSLCALRFFYTQYTTNHSTLGEPYKRHWQHLERLITRLQVLENFIWNGAPNENFYDGEYQQFRFNFRELYARADSLYKLPIIPLMDGSLGETASRDQGINSFHFGIKVKMGGNVSARKQIPTGMEKELVFDVFHYQINLLDPFNTAHQTGMKSKKAQSYVEKIMTILLTYYFVFKEDTLPFDPQEHFITHVLPIFSQPDQEKKKQLLAALALELRESANAKAMVTDLQRLFRALLKQKNHLVLPPPYTFDLRVRNGLLEQKLSKIQDSRSFFQPKMFEGKNKKALKYVTIEPDSVKADALCKLNATISMDDVLFIPSTETPETYQMSYHLTDTIAFPAFFVPAHDSVREIYKYYIDDQWRVLFPYKLKKVSEESWNGDGAYIYRTVYALLTFLCLSLLLQYVSGTGIDAKSIFLALFRLHAQKEDVSFQETFMGELSRVLAHLFAETYQAEHQGLYIGDFSQALQKLKARHEEQRKKEAFIYPSLPQDVRGRMQNARSSLYTKITRTAVLPHRKNDPLSLKKFALLAVSGRESDAVWNDQEYKYLTMHGEVITFDALDGFTVTITAKKSFSYNIDSEKAYTAPTILADLTSELYQQGYEHILYLAHSPHTSTLRIPHQNGAPFKENRFFMEESVIRTMKADKPKLVIYPVFFDTFYVFSLSQQQEENSFYIRDMEELSQIIQDPSQRIIPFFYLFNGITIGDREKYRGVTAYSTFLNFYNNDIVSNEHIHLGLLYEKGPIRRDILTYLTLFHFVRNEKSGKNKLLRRDPYREIIGDGSVGRHALYSHGKTNEGVEFNMLSFLTEVRKIVNTHQL